MNIFILTGRLTRDPQDFSKKKGKKGYTMARFTIACDAYRNEEKTADFVPCMAWGNIADVILKYTEQGSLVSVSGHIQTGSYEDEDGETVYTTDMVVEKLDLLSSSKEEKKSSKKSAKKSTKKPSKRRDEEEEEDEDEDEEED